MCPIRLVLGGQAGYGQCFFGEGCMALYGEGYVGGVEDWYDCVAELWLVHLLH